MFRPIVVFAAFVSFCCGGVTSVSTNDLLIGAGGNLSSISIAADNTMVVRTDTYGAYKWNPSATAPNGTTGTWQQIVTVASMPVQFAANGQFFQDGVYEIQVCYSNSSIMYMMYLSYEQTGTLQSTVYKTTNGGATWVATGFTPVNQLSGNITPWKQYGPKIAIDPQNCSKVFVGTSNSLLVTTNGGTSFTAISTSQVPAANGNGYSGMLVHPTNSNIVYVNSLGNGVYKSSDGGSTFSHLATGTGPTNGLIQAAIDASTGNYYAVDVASSGSNDGVNLWLWNGSTWNETISGSINDANVAAVAVDPNLGGHVVAIANHGEINETFNSGGSWSGFSLSQGSGGITLSTTGDIPWMTSLGAGTVQPNNCFFDISIAKTLHCPTANGFWTNSPWSGNITTSTAITWNSQGRGVEQLVAIGIMSSPQYSTPFTSSWDRSGFHPNLTSYPTAIVPLNGTGLLGGESLDYDAIGGSGLVCGAFNGMFYGNNNQASSCTTDGINWTAFNTYPSNAYPNSGSVGGVENLAVSNATDMFFATEGSQPHYTTNYTISASPSITWNAVSCPNVINSATISSGTYNSSTGVVTLTLSASVTSTVGYPLYISNLTGSGTNLNSLSGNFTIASVSGTTVTYNGPTGQGSITITGGTLSGWGIINGTEFNGGTNTRILAADRVTANLYYFYLQNAGFFQVSGGTCTAQAAINGVPSGASFNGSMQLQTVPGVGGEYWVTVGNSGNPGGQPANTVSGLMYTVNGGAAFTPVTNIGSASAIGFGAPLGGQTHPAVYVAGWYKVSITGQSFTVANTGTATPNLPSGLNLAINSSVYFDDGSGNKQWASIATYNNATGASTINLASFAGSGTHSSWTFMAWGVWQCTVSCNASGTPAWVQMVGWPNNSFDTINTVYGDASVFNRLYVGHGGSGFDKFNFLLKRDLDPYANDNSPMWIEKAA